MVRYPAAEWRPLPEANREPMITASQVILHTAVSAAASLWPYFARPDVTVESHFYVDQHGRVEQYIDTARQADANRTANARAVSIETWDGGNPADTPWNPPQLRALEDLLVWLCRTHRIPARQCPAHDQPGVGWHTMWGAPSPWTPVAKDCPGRPRKAQCPPLIARVAARLAPKEDDVTEAEMNAIADRVVARIERRLDTDRSVMRQKIRELAKLGADDALKAQDALDVDPSTIEG